MIIKIVLEENFTNSENSKRFASELLTTLVLLFTSDSDDVSF
jgi:hypothetical protein